MLLGQSLHTQPEDFFSSNPLASSINTEHVSPRGLRKHIHFCLLVKLTMTAWHGMHVSFDLMRVVIFNFACIWKNRAGKGPNQLFGSHKHYSYQLWYDECQTK
jgi:hypothetical protein